MNSVVTAAWAGLRKEFPLPTAPGWCLKLVRLVVERALNLPDHGFYTTFLEGHERAEPPHSGWRARDAEHILREKYAVHDMRPGDLLCDHELAPPYGHIAILLDHSFVLENCAKKYRPYSYYIERNPKSAIALTPLKHWPTPTTILRLPEEL